VFCRVAVVGLALGGRLLIGGVSSGDDDRRGW